MADSWVTIQLPQTDEVVEEGPLRGSLRALLPNLEIFLPSLTYKDRKGSYTYSLFDGYVFVRGPYTEREFYKLADSPYVKKILTYGSGERRMIAYTPDEKIQEMRHKLLEMIPNDFEVGAEVHVVRGVYKGLRGKVVGEAEDSSLLVEVYMPWGSLTKLTPIPRMFLSNDEDGA